MGEADLRAAHERIEMAEKRLTALHDHGIDPGALAGRLAFARAALAEGRLTDAEAIGDEVTDAARRLVESGIEPGTEARRRARSGPDPRLEARFADLREQMMLLIHDQVRGAVAAAMPPAPSETDLAALVSRAIGSVPSHGDLVKLGDGVRADMEWRIERIAAERGWCSLADVQAVINKAVHTTGSAAVQTPNFSRLEAALSEFVQQSLKQQERFVQALHDRVERQTAALARIVLPGEGAQPPSVLVAPVDADPPSERIGHDSNFRPTPDLFPQPGWAGPTPTAKDAVGSEAIAAAAGQAPQAAIQVAARRQVPESDRAHMPPPIEATSPDSTAFFSDLAKAVANPGTSAAAPAIAAAVQEGRVRELVSEEIERRLPEVRSSPGKPAAGSACASAPESGAAPPPALDQVRDLIVSELDRRLADLPPGLSDAALRPALARLLPAALKDEQVRQQIFALIAIEAVANPGALGELTGLRSFLRREVQRAAGEWQREMVGA